MSSHLLSGFTLSSVGPHLISAGFALVLLSMIVYPLAYHFICGWRQKADDILLSMSDRSAQLYLDQFQTIHVELDKAKRKFTQFYNTWYGRRFLVFPIVMIVLVAGFSAYLLGETAEITLRRFSGVVPDAKDYFALPRIAAAAVVGAYAFASWDIISRVARRDLGPNDILGTAIRLTIAIPLGYAFSSLLKDPVGPFIAFAAGAFPLQTVQTMLQRLANKQLQLEMGADSAADQVTRLSGVDRPTADRIEEADITTIPQLAYCDPVQLSMRTHLPFAYVSDIVAQALAWIYLEEQLKKLRCIGLRGAVEFRHLVEEMKDAGKTKIDVAQPKKGKSGHALVLDLSKIETARAHVWSALVPNAAKAVNMSEVEFLNVAFEIALDPYTEFLYATW